jgi:hypothetical protein
MNEARLIDAAPEPAPQVSTAVRLAITRQVDRERTRKAAKSRTWLERSITSRSFVRRAWQLRRLRYGPSGRRPVDVRLASRLAGNPPGAWRVDWSDWSI